MDNVNGIIQGQRHGKLTKKGIEQAKKLAERLKDEKIDVIFSSDLQRVVDTTKEIAKYHNVPIHYTSELREISFGIFEGKHRADYLKYLEKTKLSELDFKPEGGEDNFELRDRVKGFLDKLFIGYKNKTVLISSHGRTNKVLLGLLLNRDLEEALKIKQFNCCMNVVKVGEGERKTYLINCIKHL